MEKGPIINDQTPLIPTETRPPNDPLFRLYGVLKTHLDNLEDKLLDKHPKQMLQLKLLEMRQHYPKDCGHLIEAAKMYTELGLYNNENKSLPDNPNPQITQNFRLIKDLEPLHLWRKGLDKSSAPVIMELRVLETLDYCYNPARMASRTRLSELDVISISKTSREAVVAVGTSLMGTAYQTEPLNRKQINPDSFSRPLAVFLTIEDIKTIYGKNVGGFANEVSKTAFVAVDNKRHIAEHKTK